MKGSKFILWVAIAALVALAIGLFATKGCKQEEEVVAPTFTEYLMEDFDYVKSLENDSTHVALYEVETVLNGNIAETPAEELAIVSSMTVFAVEDTVYYKTRTWETGEVVTEKEVGTWLGDYALEHPNLDITFEKAVELLYAAAADSLVVLPAGDKMTFRRPAYAGSLAPLYIFGTKGTNFVAVNAVTGEVAPIE